MLPTFDQNIIQDTSPKVRVHPFVSHSEIARHKRILFYYQHGIFLFGILAAGALISLYGWYWSYLAVFLAMHFLTGGVGISVGFHRYFSHESFEARHPFLRNLLAVLGSMAGQGPIINWVSTHRAHHRYSDRPKDPHSPMQKGFWHAHVGWILNDQLANSAMFSTDLLKDSAVRNINKNYLLWLHLGLILPGLIFVIVEPSLYSFVTGIVFGGLCRLGLSMHAGYIVNSFCHRRRRAPSLDRDRSRNVFGLATVTFGESWHHNHHIDPQNANFSKRFWQIDLGYVMIKILRLGGLIHEQK